MLAHSPVLPCRVLIIATDTTSIIAQAMRARYTHMTVVEATTLTALANAVTHGPYDAICLQYPLSWVPMPSVTQILRRWLPTSPILPFALDTYGLVLDRLVDMTT